MLRPDFNACYQTDTSNQKVVWSHEDTITDLRAEIERLRVAYGNSYADGFDKGKEYVLSHCEGLIKESKP